MGDWREGVPEELAKHEALKDFKDAASLAKSYVETKALVGASLRVPGPDATPEARKEFIVRLHEKLPNVTYLPQDANERAAVEPLMWKALGKPEKPDGYDAKGVDSTGVQLDLEDLRKSAHALGLTQAQFQAFAGNVVKSMQERAQGVKLWQDTLKKEWGLAYDDKLRGAVDTATKLGAPASVIEQLRAGQLHPDHAKFFSRIAEAVGGTGREVGNQGAGKTGSLTPQEAMLKIEEVRADPAYMRAHENPAKHALLMDRIKELMPQAYPELVGK